MLTRLARIVGGIVSFLFLGLVLIAGGVALLFGTSTGQDFVREQTISALGRLLGPAYEASLGEQSFEFREDGTLAISWSGVRLQRRDEVNRAGDVRRVSVGLRLLPLAGGRLEFGRLEIDGARIDLTAFGEPPARSSERASDAVSTAAAHSVVGRSAESVIRTFERQLQALQAFHFDTVEFRDIVVEGVSGLPGDLRLRSAELHRDIDGSLQLATDLQVGALPVHLAGSALFGTDDQRLRAMSLRSSPIAVGDFAPPASEDDVFDERPFGSDAAVWMDVSLRRDTRSDVPVLSAGFHSGPGAIQVGLNHTRVESADLMMEYRGGEDRLTIVRSPMRFRDVSFDLQGEVAPVREADGQTDPDRLGVRIGSDEILSKVGGSGEARRASLWIAGEATPSTGAATANEMVLRTGSGMLAGSASRATGGPDALNVLKLAGTSLSARDVKAFWPFLISGRARDWVLRHVGDDGTVPDASISLEVREDRLGVAFKPENQPTDRELSVDVSLESVDSATTGSLPRIVGAQGSLQVRGSTTTVDVSEADVEGFNDVRIAPSRVTMSKPTEGDKRDLMVALELDASGPLNQLLTIANAEPIHALRSVEFDATKATGSGRGQVGANLRLGRYVARKDQVLDWTVSAELQDASPGQPIQGQRIEHLTGPVDIKPGQLDAKLQGDVAGLPADLVVHLPFGDQPVGDRKVALDLAVPAKRVADLVPALSDVLEGDLRAAVDVGQNGIVADIDLRRAGIDLPSIAWKKGPGVPASLRLSVAQDGDQTRLRNIALTGEGFSATGEAVVDADGLRSAKLKDVALNPGDDVSVDVERQRGGLAVRVAGDRFDARPILAELRNSIGGDDTKRPGGGTFDVAADVETLTGFNGRSISNFTLNYASAKGRMAALAFTGETNGGGTLRGDLSPRPSGRSMRISSNDTGAMLAFSGLYGHMEGGQAVLELVGDPDAGYQGALQIRNFTLVDEPRLSRIVGSSPQPGTQSLSEAVGQELRTERAFFDQASARMAYGNKTLQVADGIVRGPVFGSSFAGTLYDPRGRIDITGSFMPAYGINRIFGAIPLIGQILGNGNEGGLIGITYRLSGAFASPTLVVNPISAIAPGIFRSIFAFQ
ncbi:AsmA-like C-terminal region [Aureimonas jatrophae]|uniref:AsmA-like C-terminal region n=1 Tax=Aureimonas jatrophae TaxID=1166073 RepID=A0A1H0MDY0_9HYPH|nr:AsmA-like C-terminal region [Aureimonas jatrophae]